MFIIGASVVASPLFKPKENEPKNRHTNAFEISQNYRLHNSPRKLRML
jgi:hypothetical protein